MEFWSVLGLSPTEDINLIKKAYRVKLKTTRPDDDEEAFIRLRDAYEQALEYAETKYNDAAYDVYEEEYESYDGYEELSPEYAKYLEWTRRLDDLYNDYYRRNQISEWRKLLFDDIPYQLSYYRPCRTYIFEVVYLRYERVYLPREVRLLLDDFFTFAGTPLARAKAGDEKTLLTSINRRIKLCENIQFNKLSPLGMKGMEIDEFFYKFDQLISVLPYVDEHEKIVDELMQYPLFYLPLKCLHIYIHFDKFSNEEILDSINKLEQSCDVKLPGVDKLEIEILKACFAIHTGNISHAKKMLEQLYMKVSTKDYLSVYFLVQCCMDTDMYYETYMLIKQLTWLNPREFMYEMADDVYHKLEKEYLVKLKNGSTIDDLEHIHMCRMYLRSNREAEAVKVLSRVKDVTRYQWEYEVAHAMCIFYEDSVRTPGNLYVLGLTNNAEEPMEVMKAKPVFKILESLPKDGLSNIDRLEWQELQGRYLFEQRRYEECDMFCNELLEEYPVSYPILTLRAYADYNAHTYGNNDRFTEYMDLTYLVNAMPQRSEIRLVVAQVLSFSDSYDEVMDIMEPLKDVFPDHYRWYELIAKYKEKDSKELLLGIKDMFVQSLSRELDIPPVSKYRLLDLRNIFTYACNYVWSGYIYEEVEEIYRFLLTLKDSHFNHPEIYMEEGYLYKVMGMVEEAAAVELAKLKNASEREQKRLYSRLVDIYMDDYENLRKYVKYVGEECGSRAMGYTAETAGQYEVAIYNMEKAVAYNAGVINQYQCLGRSYRSLGRHEEAIKAYEMGIRKIDITGNSVTAQTNSYIEIACEYLDLSRYEECLKYLEMGKKYICNQKALARYYFLLGLCYTCMEKDDEYTEQIIDAYSNAVKLRYEALTLYSDIANLYVYINEPEKAIEVLNIGLEITGPSGDYTYNPNGIGNLYYELYAIYCDEKRDYDKAFEYLELMKNNTKFEHYQKDYYYRTGFVYYLMDDMERMKTAWLKAAELKLTYPLIYGELSFVFEDVNEKLEILNKGIEIIDGCVDFNNNNLYEQLYFAYMESGDYANAYDAALALIENTRNDRLSLEGNEMAGTAALVLERVADANKLYQKKIDILKERGEEASTGIIMNNFIALYALRKPEAKDSVVSLFYEDDKVCVDRFVLALRADYMSEGHVDKEFALHLHDELVALIGKEDTKEIYEALVEISAALGDDDKREAYTEELFKYIDSWDDDCNTVLAWCHIYKGELKKAFEIYDADENNKALQSAPTGYTEYNFIKERMQKTGGNFGASIV